MQRLFTVEEVSAFLNLKPSTIRKWVHLNYIPCLKLGRAVRFDMEMINEWLKSKSKDGRPTRRIEIDIN